MPRGTWPKIRFSRGCAPEWRAGRGCWRCQCRQSWRSSPGADHGRGRALSGKGREALRLLQEGNSALHVDCRLSWMQKDCAYRILIRTSYSTLKLVSPDWCFMKAGLSVGELLKESKSKSRQSVSRETEAPPEVKKDSHHFSLVQCILDKFPRSKDLSFQFSQFCAKGWSKWFIRHRGHPW